jgi:hypothetical protein
MVHRRMELPYPLTRWCRWWQYYRYYAQGEAEAQALAEAKLRTQRAKHGKACTFVKGRDPRLTCERVGLIAMPLNCKAWSGRLHVNVAAPHTPSPYLDFTAIQRTIPTAPRERYGRSSWSESSHGLSVSEYPRFLRCDVDGYSTLPLPCEAVKDEKRWDGISPAVVCRTTGPTGRPSFRNASNVLGKIKRRSAEDADQLRQDKADTEGTGSLRWMDLSKASWSNCNRNGKPNLLGPRQPPLVSPFQRPVVACF